MPAINKHYVPVHYLEGFTNAKTGKVFMYWKEIDKVIETGLNNVANEIDYWSDETELMVAQEIEAQAHLTLDKIRERQAISDEERDSLSNYIVAMLIRVPAGQDWIISLAQEKLPDVRERLIGQLASQRWRDPKEKTEAENWLEQLRGLDAKAWDQEPKKIWQRLLSPEFYQRAAGVLMQMTWVFATRSDEHGFLTSDNPVIFTRQKGLKRPHGELVFPLSNRIALLASWDQRYSTGYLPVDEALADEVNYWIVRQASNYIFYSGHKNWIESMIRRIRKQARQNVRQ